MKERPKSLIRHFLPAKPRNTTQAPKAPYKPTSSFWLVLWAASVALWLCGVRYIGLAVVVGAAVFCGSWRQRIAVCIQPVVVYVVGILLTDVMRPHFPQMGSQVQNVLNVPWGVAAAIGGVAIVFVVVGLVRYGWSSRLVRMISGAVVAYLIALLGTVIAQRYDPALDLRLFVPVIPLIAIVAIGLTINQAHRLASWLLCGLLVANVWSVAKSWKFTSSTENKVLNHNHFRHNKLMDFVRVATDSGHTIYTNSPYAVWQNAKRITKHIPCYATSKDPNPILASDMAMVESTGGFLVWFTKDEFHYPPDSFIRLAAKDGKGRIIGGQDANGRWLEIKQP